MAESHWLRGRKKEENYLVIRPRLLRIDPSMVYFLRFILEGYDNLFVLSTLDARSGLVEIHYVESSEDELDSILTEIGPSIGLVSMGEASS